VIALTAGLLFLVYLNVPAVAVRIHGAPFMLGAAVPMALALPVLHRMLVRSEPLRVPSVMIAAVVMLLLQGLSALASDRPLESLGHVETWLIEGVVLALLIANALRTPVELRVAARALIAAGAVMGAITLLQQALGAAEHPFFGFGQLDAAMSDEGGRIQYRLAGPIGETNRFAQIMAVLIPIGAGCVIGAASRGARAAYLAAIGLIGAGMALAFSRGAIVALVLAIPVALAIRLLRWRQLVAVVLLGIAALAVMPRYAERVASIGQLAVRSLGLDPAGLRNADGAARGRLTEMKSAALLFVEHPILGAGPGLAPYAYEEYAGVVGGKVRPGTRRSHNLYLQMAAETGLVGLGAFAVVIGLAFREVDRARRRFESTDRRLWGLACGLELALVISLTTSLFLHAAYIRYFWVLIGMATAIGAQPGTPALAAFLSRMLHESARHIRADQAKA